MAVLEFAKDLTHLIFRYTRTMNSESLSDIITPLNNVEIVFAIHQVLDALKIKDFNDKNNNGNPLEMSNGPNDNADINPETLAITIKCENMEDIDRCSEDVQSVFTNDSSVSDISLPVIKREREGSFDVLQNGKKFISQSNPAICINNIGRSDTFICEENQKSTEEEVYENNNLLENVQVTLNEIRESFMNITVKLNNLEQSLPQKLSNKIMVKNQKSSRTNSYTSPRISTINKTKSINTRKSSSILLQTPTSSKMPATGNENISERRKSTGGLGTNAASTAGKSGAFTKVDTSHDNSISILNSSACSKKSPSTEIRPHKFTKNPKYAHVRSTIPKAISQKKKMQEP